jgi:hypothetical protein
MLRIVLTAAVAAVSLLLATAAQAQSSRGKVGGSFPSAGGAFAPKPNPAPIVTPKVNPPAPMVTPKPSPTPNVVKPSAGGSPAPAGNRMVGGPGTVAPGRTPQAWGGGTKFTPPPNAPDRPKKLLAAPAAEFEAKNRVQKHHIIPQQLKDHPAVQRAGKGGFDLGSFKQNGFRLPSMTQAELNHLRATGVGQGRDGRAMDTFLKRSNHLGPHPGYTADMKAKLDALHARGQAAGWTPTQYRAEMLKVVRDTRAGLRNNSVPLVKPQK